MSNFIPPDQDESGRLGLAVGGILFIPVCAMATWGVLFELPMPQDFFGCVARIVLDELAITATLFFTVGFLWGITGSRGLKRFLDMAAVRLAWFVFPMILLAFAAAGLMFVLILWQKFLQLIG